jgi:zinc transporter 1/2/3
LSVIGVTLIVAGDSAYISLFIVIIFHQAFEGLALGSRIAELGHATLQNKLLMALAFALITPIGMAIGLGVINTFNGNDRNTLIAMGTLDALSAGILTWASLVDMVSHDWMYGDMKDAPPVRTALGMLSLIAGMVLMGLLGKWA